MAGKTRALGLCLGASTVSLVQVEAQKIEANGNATQTRLKPIVVDYSFHSHEGNPKQTLISTLEKLDLTSFDTIAATGRRFRHFVMIRAMKHDTEKAGRNGNW